MSDAGEDSVRGPLARGMVDLKGSPEAIGATWGQINGATIRSDLEQHFVRPAAAAGIDAGQLAAQAAVFAGIAADMAPHWLAELEAVAHAADVDAELYLGFAANVYRQLFLHPECTSYAVHRAFARDGAIFFHKTRDNVARSQCAAIIDSSVPAVQRFATISDASVPACMMMVNEAGLAGSADTGGLAVRQPRFRGLMNTFVLRHIAERADSCAAALDLVREMARSGRYAGGDRTGTHWLFVDRGGAVLEVSCNSDEVWHTYHDEKLYISARAESQAAQRLRTAPGPIDFQLFHLVSRDPSLCFDSSIAGMSVEIDAEYPSQLSCAWIALPARSLAVPLFLGQEGTPECLLDGALDAAGTRLSPRARLWEALEAGVHCSKEAVRARAAALLRAGQRDGAAALLGSWSNAQARAALALLCELAAGDGNR